MLRAGERYGHTHNSDAAQATRRYVRISACMICMYLSVPGPGNNVACFRPSRLVVPFSAVLPLYVSFSFLNSSSLYPERRSQLASSLSLSLSLSLLARGWGWLVGSLSCLARASFLLDHHFLCPHIPGYPSALYIIQVPCAKTKTHTYSYVRLLTDRSDKSSGSTILFYLFSEPAPPK
jgi:hypothetical protein